MKRRRIYLTKDSTLTKRRTPRIVGYLDGADQFIPYKKSRVGDQIQIVVVTKEQADEYDRKIKARLEKRIKEDTSIN